MTYSCREGPGAIDGVIGRPSQIPARQPSARRLAAMDLLKAVGMTRLKSHSERHAVSRIGWLRAAVLGANDGIVSTASLIVGVAASGAGKNGILVAGTAALVAGAMSMAAGEYVSVSSQADTEKADLARETKELASQPDFERKELADIYIARGLDADLAQRPCTRRTGDFRGGKRPPAPGGADIGHNL